MFAFRYSSKTGCWTRKVIFCLCVRMLCRSWYQSMVLREQFIWMMKKHSSTMKRYEPSRFTLMHFCCRFVMFMPSIVIQNFKQRHDTKQWSACETMNLFYKLYAMLWWNGQWTKHRWSLRNQFKTYFCFKPKHQQLYFVISLWSWLEMDCLFSSCYILSNSGLVVVQQMNYLMLHALKFIPLLKIELELSNSGHTFNF